MQYPLPFPDGLRGLDLEKLLTGDVNRLRYIRRFGLALTLHKENVAEHSFYVSIYSYFIAKWVQVELGLELDMMRIMEAGLFHDLEETRTGDFPRPFKYRRPGLKHLLDLAAADEFRTIITDLMPGNEEVEKHLQFIFETAKDEHCMEGCVVALADYLSVISHLWQEVNCSNASMYDHYTSVLEYLDTFNDGSYDFIRPIVVETRRITLGIFDNYVKRKNEQQA